MVADLLIEALTAWRTGHASPEMTEPAASLPKATAGSDREGV